MHQRTLSTAIGAFLCVHSVAPARAMDVAQATEVFAGAHVPATSGEARARILFVGAESIRLGSLDLDASPETARRNHLLKAKRADQWTSFDKVQHAAFSFLATLSGQYVLVNKAGWSESKSLPASISLAAGAGVGKELYDWRVGPSRYFSTKDLVADAIGIAVAVAIIAL